MRVCDHGVCVTAKDLGMFSEVRDEAHVSINPLGLGGDEVNIFCISVGIHEDDKVFDICDGFVANFPREICEDVVPGLFGAVSRIDGCGPSMPARFSCYTDWASDGSKALFQGRSDALNGKSPLTAW